MTIKIVLVALTINIFIMSFVIYGQYLIFRKVYGPKKVKDKNKRSAFVPEQQPVPKKRYRARDYPERRMRD